MPSVFLHLIDEVIRIDANAMTADESRPEVKRIPLRIHGIHHFFRVNAHAMEGTRKFIHEGDVDIALRVLDEFRRFSHLDAGSAVDRRDGLPIDLRDGV